MQLIHLSSAPKQVDLSETKLEMGRLREASSHATVCVRAQAHPPAGTRARSRPYVQSRDTKLLARISPNLSLPFPPHFSEQFKRTRITCASRRKIASSTNEGGTAANTAVSRSASKLEWSKKVNQNKTREEFMSLPKSAFSSFCPEQTGSEGRFKGRR